MSGFKEIDVQTKHDEETFAYDASAPAGGIC